MRRLSGSSLLARVPIEGSSLPAMPGNLWKPGVFRALALTLLIITTLASCGKGAPVVSRTPGESIDLSQGELIQLLPDTAKAGEKPGWARAILDALRRRQIPPSEQNVCAVVAVIDQESNFSANPRVKNLGNIVLNTLYQDAVARTHRTAAELLLTFLKSYPSREDSFYNRIKRAETEKDIDYVYRDIVIYMRTTYPVKFMESMTSWFVGQDVAERFHPIRTAGSMQVSVEYAASLAGCDAKEESCAWRIRDELYSREGGVYYGVARLLGYRAGYDTMLFRFADFNAGQYASRNASLQSQIARLSKQRLALDGDLLSYDARGNPSAGPSQTELAIRRVAEKFVLDLDQDTIHKDLALEKDQRFEQSKTYRQLIRLFKSQYSSPPYAILPQVALKSPKLSQKRTTEWFANSVMNRYKRCLSKSASLGSKKTATGGSSRRPPQ